MKEYRARLLFFPSQQKGLNISEWRETTDYPTEVKENNRTKGAWQGCRFVGYSMFTWLAQRTVAIQHTIVWRAAGWFQLYILPLYLKKRNGRMSDWKFSVGPKKRLKVISHDYAHVLSHAFKFMAFINLLSNVSFIYAILFFFLFWAFAFAFAIFILSFPPIQFNECSIYYRLSYVSIRICNCLDAVGI